MLTSDNPSRRLADAALNLAAFRIIVGMLFLTTIEVRTAARWATLSPTLAVAPDGWGWALALFPPSTRAAHIAQIVMLVGAACGLVGLYARAAFACTTAAALYLLALPLRSGMPYHDQHLVWFAAICAVSPCADALAVDQWRRRRRGAPPPARSIIYGVPLRVAWLLVGAIFFFSGLWKLRGQGLGWITSDSLRNQLYWKWMVTPGLVPPFRIDRVPWLLHAGAAAVVAFELLFGVAVWHRRTRYSAVAAALVFHLFARLFMGIDFSGLWLTYVVFIDWQALVHRWTMRGNAVPPKAPSRSSSADPPPLARVMPATIVGVVVLTGAIQAGLRGVTIGWPFACYPTFHERVGTLMPVLAVSAVGATGHEVAVDVNAGVAPAARPRERAFGLRLVATAGSRGASDAFATYGRLIVGRTPAGTWPPDTCALRFYAARVSTLPEDRGAPPRNPVLLHQLVLDASRCSPP